MTEPTPSLKDVVFSVVDTERVSKQYGDRIISMSVVQVDVTGRIINEFHSLLDPGTPIDCGIAHRIKAETLQGKPVFADIADSLKTMLDGTVFVSHNVKSDLEPLNKEFARCGWSLYFLGEICTVMLAKKLYPEWQRHRLPACCKNLGITLEKHHDAVSDARATAKLFTSLSAHVEATNLADFLCQLGFFDVTALAVNLDHPFVNKTILFTGQGQARYKGRNLQRQQRERILEQMGMKTTYKAKARANTIVVKGMDASRSKVKTAISNGMSVITEQEFWGTLATTDTIQS